jgi:nicotinate-nucleotide adenylyltransferase
MIKKLLRIGIFGGTFDPPHIGHLILASEAYAQLELDCVLWVLTPHPPHKAGRTMTLLTDRLEMLQAATNHDPAFEVSRIDIDRIPPHYAVDTMQLLHGKYPGARLIYLMGGDSLVDLPLWHKPREFILACDGIGVMRRSRWKEDLESLERQLPGLTDRVRFIDAPSLDVSSSFLRLRIAEASPYRYYVPPEVYDIIQNRRLYSDSTDSR